MNKSYVSFMKEYTEIHSFSSRYKLVQNTFSGRRFIVQTAYPQNVPLLKLKAKTLEQHTNIRHEYFLSENGQPTLIGIYEAGMHTLIEEVEARAEESKSFKQNQIWAILYGIISAMSSIQSLGVQCGNLSMDLIFLTENGQAKIVDPSFIHGISDLEPNKYYSPEEIALLMNPNAESDIFKSNVFIAALCVLHCCLLTPSYDYINLSTATIDFDFLEQLLEQASQTYSEELIRLLVDMLDEELASRPDFIELEEQINRICVVQESSSGTMPVPADIQNTRDQKNQMHQVDQMSQPDIGEGALQEPNDRKLPKLELNALQMSLSNNSSLDGNKGKGYGLDQLKNLKIADSLSYSGADLEPVSASNTVQDSLDVMNPRDSYLRISNLKQSSFPHSITAQFPRSHYPYSSKMLSESPLGYTYTPSTYTPLISNTDESGLFTSPELLSFLKVDLISNQSNENLNPN